MKPAAPTINSVTTIKEDGSRRFIHPATVSGRFAKLRTLVFGSALLIYAVLPWIQIGGHPAVQFDVINGRFYLFGITFVPQDLWLGFFVITGLGFTLFYATALFGRLWCGWACPQTIFLDVVRRIERFVEGDAVMRRQLDNSILTFPKFIKRAIKHFALVAFAFVLSHLFLSYFVSLPQLYSWMQTSPSAHWSAFLLVGGMTTALWFDFAWFREQFCIVLCPYGRLQSALLDTDTVTIGYDTGRGEPRSKRGTENSGDCVDCLKCVQVCPTGIDIRQGLQIECIACAACIDACDSVMDKLGRKPGLIRYDSQHGFAGERTRWIRPRMILYTLFLLVGIGVASGAILSVKPMTVTVNRVVGAPYYIDASGLRNQFLLRIFNKQNHEETFEVTLVNPPPGLEVAGDLKEIKIGALEEAMVPVVLTIPRDQFHKEFGITLSLTSASGAVVTKPISFLGPISL